MRNVFLLFSFLISSITFAADRVIPCDGANCKIIFETKNGSNVKVQAAQIDGTGVMSFPNAGGGMVPAGTIIAFAGASTPAGYLPCDGAAVSQTTYAALYAALGSTWDTAAKQDGTGGNWTSPGGGNFRVPDLRGQFLRGTGTSSRSDGSGDVSVTLGSMRNDTTNKNGLTASAAASSVSVSGNKNQFNTNQTSNIIVRLNASGWGTNAVAITNATGTQSTETTLTSTTWTGTFTASGTADAQSITVNAGDTETGPRSIGVNYFIKY